MYVRHPYALDPDGPEPDDAVHWGGRRRIALVDENGVFKVPDGNSHFLDEWAKSYGYTLEELIVEDYTPDYSDYVPDETEGEDADADGEVTVDDAAAMIERGVCPWCDPEDADRYEGDHVGRHASSAHPEAWQAYRDRREAGE